MENGGLILVMNQAQISIFNASLADLNLKIGISNSILHGNAQGKKRIQFHGVSTLALLCTGLK